MLNENNQDVYAAANTAPTQADYENRLLETLAADMGTGDLEYVRSTVNSVNPDYLKDPVTALQNIHGIKPSMLEVKAEQLSNISERNKELLSNSEVKTEELKVNSEINKQKLDPNTPVNFKDLSLEQFLDTYGNKGVSNTELAATYFGLRSLDAQEQEKRYAERVQAFSSRTPTEVVADTALGVAKFPLMVGETAYSIANLFTGGNLENSLNFGGNFGESRDIINSAQSMQSNLQREYSEEEFQQLTKQEELFRDNTKSVWEKLQSFGREYTGGASILIENPNVLWDTVIESGLAFTLPAAVANGVRQAALKGLTAEQRNEFLADTAKMSQLQRNEKLAALLSISALEAGGNSIDVQNTILNTSFEDLEKNSELYRSLIADGVNQEDARKQVAANAFLTTYAITFGGAGVVSKLTGSDKLAAELGDRLGSIGNRLFQTARAGGIEGTEESLQSGLGAFATNVGTSIADNTQSLSEGVAGSAGQGGISGALSGAGVQGAVAALQTSGDVLQPLVKKGAEIAQDSAVAKQVEQAEQSGDFSSLAPVAEDNALKSILKIKRLATSIAKEEVISDPDKINQITELFDQLQADFENKTFNESKNEITNSILTKPSDFPEIENAVKAFQNTESTPEQKSAAIAEINTYVNQKANERLTEILDDESSDFNVATTQVAAAYSSRVKVVAQKITEQQELTKQDVKDAVRAFGSSPDSFELTDIDTFINSNEFNKLPLATRNIIQASRNFKQALINAESVSDVILNGGELDGQKWRGVNTYVNQYNRALKSGNQTNADNAYNELRRWYLTRKEKLQEWLAKPKTDRRQDTINTMQQENAAMMAAMRFMAAKKGVAVNNVTQGTNNVTDTDTTTVPTTSQEETIQSAEATTEQVSTEASTTESTVAQTGNTAEQSQTATASVDSQAAVNTAETHLDNSEINDEGLNDSTDEPVKTSALQKLISTLKTYVMPTGFGNLSFNSFYKLTQPSNKLSEIDNLLEANQAVIDDTFDTAELDVGAWNKIKALSKAINDGFNNINLSVNTTNDKTAFLEINNNPLTVLVDENGNLPEQIKTIMSLTLAKFLATDFNIQRETNEEKNIRNLLGLEESDYLAQETLSATRRAGTRLDMVTEALAVELQKALGIKPSDSLNGEMYVKASHSLASNLIAAATSAGIFQKVEVQEFAKDAKSKSGFRVVSRFNFIRLARGTNGKFTEDSRSIVDLKDNVSWFEKLFNENNLSGKPTTEKPNKLSNRYSSNNPLQLMQKVDGQTQDIILEHSQRPNSVMRDMWNYFEVLPLELQELVAGTTPDEFMADKHIYERETLEAANESIQRSFDNLKQFISEIVDEDGNFTDFYFTHVLWGNGRLGIDGSYVNPQESKFIRHFLNLKQFEVTVDPKDTKTMLMFKAAVGTAFGLKLDHAEAKQINDKFDQIINEPLIQEMLDKLTNNDWNPETDMQKMYQLLHTGIGKIEPEHPTHAFHALVALASYKDADGGKFTTTLSLEVDGKTNGFAFSALQFTSDTSVGALTEAMERAGVYTTDGMNFKKWKVDEDNKDTYEVLSKVMTEQAASLSPNVTAQDKALGLLVGFNVVEGTDSQGNKTQSRVYEISRKLAKQPVMVTMYGSGIEGVINSFVEDVITNMYNTIANSSDDAKEVLKRDMTIRALKQLTSEANVLDINSDNKDFVLTAETEKQLRKALKDKYQETMSESLNILFGDISTSRNLLVRASQEAYKIFKQVYDIKYQDKLNEVNQELFDKLTNELGQEKGAEAFDYYKFRTLNKKQIKELIASMEKQYPVFKSYYLDKMSSGIVIPKTKNKTSTVEAFLKRNKFRIYTKKKDGTEFDLKYLVDTSTGDVKFDTLFKSNVLVSYEVNGKPKINSLSALAGNNTIKYKAETGLTISGMFPKEILPSPRQSTTVKYKNPVKAYTTTTKGKVSSRKSDDSSFTSAAAATTFDFIDPSVSVGPKGIHSLDASVQLTVLKDLAAFNVHDAFYYSLDSVERGAYLANKAFSTINQEFNIFNSGADMLSQMNLLAMDYGIFNSDNLMLVKELQEAADKSNKVKSEYFDKVAGVYQYTLNIGDGYNLKQEQIDLNISSIISTLKNTNVFGSSSESMGNFVADVEYDIAPDNVYNIYNALGSIGQAEVVQVSPEHQSRLDGLVENVFGPLVQQAKLLVQNTAATTLGSYERRGGDRVIKMQLGSQAPTTLAQSRQEVFVHEIVHAVMETPMSVPTAYRKRLEQLYGIAQKYLKPTDLLVNNTGLQPSRADLLKAEAVYEYIFQNTQVTPAQLGIESSMVQRNFSNGLHEFVAFGLTNENVIKALENLFKNNPDALKEFKQGEKYSPLKGNPKSGTFVKALNMINEIFNYVAFKVRQFMDKISGIENKQADEVLFELAVRIAHIERKQNIKTTGLTGKANIITGQVIDNIIKPITTVLDKTNTKLGRAISGTIRLFPRLDSNNIGNIFNRVVNHYGNTKDSLVAAIGRELIGRTANNRKMSNLFLMSRYFIDTMRADTAAAASTFIRSAMHRDLTVEESAAIQRALMHTDSSVLFDGNTTNLINLVKSRSNRIAEITKLNDELVKLAPKHYKYLKNHAENTGHFIVNKRELYEGDVMFNASQIVNMRTIDDVATFDTTRAKQIVEKLIALHALNYSDLSDLALASKFMQEEVNSKNNISNGIQVLMDSLKEYKKLAKETLFDQSDELQRAGYVKEVFNPNTGFVVVNRVERDQLLKQGVELIGEVPKDKHDTTSARMYLMKSDSLAMATRTRGAMGITNMVASGTNLLQARNQIIEDPDNALYAIQDFANISAKRKTANRNMNTDAPAKVSAKDNPVKPIYNNDGKVVGYRYMMNEENRIKIAERADMFDKTFGAMLGSVLDKVNNQKINKMLIDELKADYKENYKKNPKGFIKIGPTVKDQESREMWALIPKASRDYAKEVFGGDFIYVSQENYRRVFGFKRATLGDIGNWLDAKFQNTFLEQFGAMAKDLLNHRYALTIESIWKDLVSYAKDRIVIVSGSVLLLNILSNMIVLMVEGVNPVKGLKYQKEGWEQLKQFQKDGIEVKKLKLQLGDSTLSANAVKNIKAKIAFLQDRMTNNPVRPLLDRGVFQSIIEDVDMLDEQFNFASKLERKLEPFTNKIPDVVKDLGNALIMSKETAAYQFFRDATQMSDFVARYTLHKHNMDNGINFEESIDNIMDTFVNYEDPTHKSIQWLNDMGILMFTKFFLRIQKVALRQMKEKPLNVLGLWATESYLGTDLSSIDDSLMSGQNILNRFYGPAANLETALTPGTLHFIN